MGRFRDAAGILLRDQTTLERRVRTLERELQGRLVDVDLTLERAQMLIARLARRAKRTARDALLASVPDDQSASVVPPPPSGFSPTAGKQAVRARIFGQLSRLPDPRRLAPLPPPDSNGDTTNVDGD